jgi:predicted RNase H-like HicB family nuclease
VTRYLAIVHKEPGTAFGVSFPDVPGCMSASDTLDEATAMAHEALTLRLGALAEDGGPVPVASAIDGLGCRVDLRDPIVAAIVPVGVKVPALAAE